MKRNLANLLLVLGTVLGALAAAESRRANRVLDLEQPLAGPEVLAADVPGAGERPLAEAGEPLTEELRTRLLGSGVRRVRVRRPPVDHRTVPVEEAAGLVLARPVVLPGEVERVRSGRLLTADLLARAAEAGIERLRVRGPEGERDLPSAEPPEDLAGLTLAEDLELPARLAAGTFLDEPALARLRSAGVATIEAKVTAPFRLAGWEWKWGFALAVLAMIAGILLKRPAAGAVAQETGGVSGPLAEWLDEALRDARALAEDGGRLDPATLHERLDALLSGPVYAFVEAREELCRRLGIHAFAEVMGPFASAERKLNRAWSASVDRNVPEARNCLLDAVPLLEEARLHLVAGA